jgi:ferric-dicitrate binding protein FerR (iron transport regulator)
VEGTSWITTDDCKRSIVRVTEGRVRVRNLVTRKLKVLSAGHSYIALDPRKRAHKS